MDNRGEECYRQIMDNRLMRKFTIKEDKREEFFHSSGYAQVQNGSGIGSGGVDMSLEARKALEEQRKYIKGYNNSKILQGAYGVQRAKTFVPRTGGGVGGLGEDRGGSGGMDRGAGKGVSAAGSGGFGGTTRGSNGSLRGPVAPPSTPVRAIKLPWK